MACTLGVSRGAAAGPLPLQPRARAPAIGHASVPVVLRRRCRLLRVAHVPVGTEPTSLDVVPNRLVNFQQQNGQHSHHSEPDCSCSNPNEPPCNGVHANERSTMEHSQDSGHALSSSHGNGNGNGSVGYIGHSSSLGTVNGSLNGSAGTGSSLPLPASWTHQQHDQQRLDQLESSLLHPALHPHTHQQHGLHSQEQHPATHQTNVATIPDPVASEQPTSSSSSSSSSSGSTSSSSSKAQDHQHVPGIPQPVLVLSLVSASLTLASCVFNTLLPIYMVSELKMDLRSLGMFEGLLEAFSYIVRMFSGVVSDFMTSRKSAITLGFAMGAAAKFGMSGATEVSSLFASKALDRLANGVQAAPRDALISDLAPSDSRGACFGFAQSMRKWGSALGALLVYLLMRASGNNYQLIFLMAATLSMASCVAFVLLVPSHVRPTTPAPASASTSGSAAPAPARPTSALAALPQIIKGAAGMGGAFFRMQLLVCLYCMANIGESLLEARAMEVGFGKAESTLVVATLAAAIFVVAYPLGRLDDKYGARVTLAIGMVALILANLVLLLSGTHPWAVFASLAFMAVHYGVMQGPLLSIVVGLAPGHLKGTAFGLFYTTMAVTAVCNNSIIGTLWQAHGAHVAFMLSAAMTCFTLLVMPWLVPEGGKPTAKAPAPVPA